MAVVTITEIPPPPQEKDFNITLGVSKTEFLLILRLIGVASNTYIRSQGGSDDECKVAYPLYDLLIEKAWSAGVIPKGSQP